MGGIAGKACRVWLLTRLWHYMANIRSQPPGGVPSVGRGVDITVSEIVTRRLSTVK